MFKLPHLLIFLLCTGMMNAQETGLGKPHNSKFKDYKEGNFEGTVNGVLSVKKEDGSAVIIDFQGSKAQLDVIHDPEEMYDVSTKQFTGFSTSGKTKIVYQFYQGANEFSIVLSNQTFSVGVMDGAHDLVILGLSYNYFQEKGMEYLSLYFEKNIQFSGKGKSKVTIQKGSALVFAIKG